MNATTNFVNVPLKHSNGIVSTLDHDKSDYALERTRISAEPYPTRNLVSGLAHSVWTASWTLHGIPELDSPLAG